MIRVEIKEKEDTEKKLRDKRENDAFLRNVKKEFDALKARLEDLEQQLGRSK